MNLPEEIADAAMSLKPHIVTIGAMCVVMEALHNDGSIHLEFLKPADQRAEESHWLMERLVAEMRDGESHDSDD